MRFAALCLALLFAALPARSEEKVSFDDTARYLAGLPAPTGQTALAPLRAERNWQAHATALDAAFGAVERNQLAKIRAWVAGAITVRKPVLYYMFSGPDFLYATSFFPDADTYIMSGLEPVGEIPNVVQQPKPALARALVGLQASMGTLLKVSFFRTLSMRTQLRATSLQGTLPVLYVFLARTGKTIKDVSLVSLSETGAVQGAAVTPRLGAPRGVKILFAGPDGRERTLYYFGTNLANESFRNGFAQFCESFGEGNGLVKSASYLLANANFSQARDFLLGRTAAILQDDTGIPVTFFNDKWQLKPFGRYLGPIGMFSRYAQPKLGELFKTGSPPRLDFGLGYRWKQNDSNLLLAVKKEPPGPKQEPPAEKKDPATVKTEQPKTQ